MQRRRADDRQRASPAQTDRDPAIGERCAHVYGVLPGLGHARLSTTVRRCSAYSAKQPHTGDQSSNSSQAGMFRCYAT
jgi:hypothetical protein